MKVHSYFSETGRDLIMEYIDSLTEDERIDALSVLECIEKDEFEEIFPFAPFSSNSSKPSPNAAEENCRLSFSGGKIKSSFCKVTSL